MPCCQVTREPGAQAAFLLPFSLPSSHCWLLDLSVQYYSKGWGTATECLQMRVGLHRKLTVYVVCLVILNWIGFCFVCEKCVCHWPELKFKDSIFQTAVWPPAHIILIVLCLSLGQTPFQNFKFQTRVLSALFLCNTFNGLFPVMTVITCIRTYIYTQNLLSPVCCCSYVHEFGGDCLGLYNLWGLIPGEDRFAFTQ